MHRAEAGLGQVDARDQRRKRHALARVRIGALAPVQPDQAVTRGAQSTDAKGVVEHIGSDGDIGLDQLRERVHAVGGDHVPGAGREQVRIDDGDFRDQHVVSKRFLEAVTALPAEHGILGRLASRARSRRHCDQRYGRARVRQFGPHAFEEVHDRLSDAQQPGDGLGRVHRAAAANAQHGIDLRGGIFTDRFVDHPGRGFAIDGHVFVVNPVLGELLQQQLPVSRGRERARPGHDQHPLAVPGGESADKPEGSAAELYTRQTGNREGIEVRDQAGYRPL